MLRILAGTLALGTLVAAAYAGHLHARVRGAADAGELREQVRGRLTTAGAALLDAYALRWTYLDHAAAQTLPRPRAIFIDENYRGRPDYALPLLIHELAHAAWGVTHPVPFLAPLGRMVAPGSLLSATERAAFRDDVWLFLRRTDGDRE